MCMYVSEICAEGIFVTFPWWLKMWKVGQNSPFSNERHFEIWFPKKRTTTFFWSKLSKLHKKDPILHVAATFSLKQGETRTSHGPIPYPLNHSSEHWWKWGKVFYFWLLFSMKVKIDTCWEYSNGINLCQSVLLAVNILLATMKVLMLIFLYCLITEGLLQLTKIMLHPFTVMPRGPVPLVSNKWVHGE